MPDFYFPTSGSSFSNLVAESEYPGKLDTNASLVEARNKATTTLTSSISSIDTEIYVDSTSLFPNTGIIVCENEVMKYSGKFSDRFIGVTRGFENTTAISHTATTPIGLKITESSNNVKNNAIRALELKLGTEASTPAAGTSLQGTGIGSSQWLPAREVLDGNRTYYVSTSTGSDANDGRTTSTKLKTIQAAVDKIARLDCAGYNVTVLVDDGTYAETVTLKSPVGVASAGALTIQGNTTTPANCVVRGFTATNLVVVWNLRGFKTTNTLNIAHLNANDATIRVWNWDFGTAGTAAHIPISNGGKVIIFTGYTISGNASAHINALGHAFFQCNGSAPPPERPNSTENSLVITVLNSPSIGVYAIGNYLSYMYLHYLVWTAQIIGRRFSMNALSVLFVAGAVPDTYMSLTGNLVGQLNSGSIAL